jgi:hypothetical protein
MGVIRIEFVGESEVGGTVYYTGRLEAMLAAENPKPTKWTVVSRE